MATMKSRSFLLLLIERALVAVGAEEEAGDPGRGAAHHIADRAEVSLRRALDNELIMHRADDETVAGRMGGRLSIPLPSGTAVPAPLREGIQGTRKGVKNRPAAAESLCNENLPRSALRYPENRSGLRCSSDSPTAAVIPQCLHLPSAAALRDSALRPNERPQAHGRTTES